MANRELAQKVLDQITAHPETHRQGYWAWKGQLRNGEDTYCGTAMCVAGWAVHFADMDAEPLWEGSPGDEAAWYVKSDRFGNSEMYADAGRAALEISEEEAHYLFNESRTDAQVIDALTDLVETGHLTPYGYGDEY